MNHNTPGAFLPYLDGSSSTSSLRDVAANHPSTHAMTSTPSTSFRAGSSSRLEDSSSGDDSNGRLSMRVDHDRSTSYMPMETSPAVGTQTDMGRSHTQSTEPASLTANNVEHSNTSQIVHPPSAGPSSPLPQHMAVENNFLAFNYTPPPQPVLLVFPPHPPQMLWVHHPTIHPQQVAQPVHFADLLPSHYYCEGCQVSFYWRSRFLFHRQYYHGNRRCDTNHTVLCHRCKAGFINVKELNRHCARVHYKVRPYKCPGVNCKREFFTKREMVLHHDVVHLRLRPYSCVFCNKSFGRPEQRNLHLRRVHQTLNPYQCATCNLEFESEEGLNEHRLTLVHAVNSAGI